MLLTFISCFISSMARMRNSFQGLEGRSGSARVLECHCLEGLWRASGRPKVDAQCTVHVCCSEAAKNISC